MTSDLAPAPRTITLELLRHGPPHNQLLSRLTEYLALCGNRAAVSVRLPLDHQEQIMRLEDLSYREGSQQVRRLAVLEEMGQHMATLLEVPGLIAELGAPPQPGQITHLRLVVTPHELALLPFECSSVPRGLASAHAKSLLLQPTTPVTLTREVRSAPTGRVRFPSRPRVLYAWAAPTGVGEVPFREHLHALRRSLDPWIMPYPGRGPGQAADEAEHRRRQVKSLLTALPNASIESIEDACAKTEFTHVHLLAHGIPKAIQAQQRMVGLALHDSRGGLDVVSGERLAAALRCRGAEARPDALPTVVTLASCDSGQVSSVIVHGASVAHSLHLAGIPVVIASQFPLSVEGSIALTDELYRRLFLGEDLRITLHEVRKSLYSRDGGRYHDWASLVTYASLPADYAEQVKRNRYELAVQAGRGLRAQAEALLTRGLLNRGADPAGPLFADDDGQQRVECQQLLAGVEVEAGTLGAWATDAAEAAGMQASIEKVRAELLFFIANLAGTDAEDASEHLRRSLLSLENSRRLYYSALVESLSHHWQLVQHLALTHVLRQADYTSEAFPRGLADVARVAAEIDRNRKQDNDRAFAHGSLAELCLLAALEDEGPEGIASLHAAKEHLRQLLESATPGGFAIHSTRRQLARYVHWWSTLARHADVGERMRELALSMIEVLDRGLGIPSDVAGGRSSGASGRGLQTPGPDGKHRIEALRSQTD